MLPNQPLTLIQILPPLVLYLHLRGRIVQLHFKALMYLLRSEVLSPHENLS